MNRTVELIWGPVETAKLTGGHIEYQLWMDEERDFYVRLIKNEASGTFPDLLFPITMGEEEIKKPSGFTLVKNTIDIDDLVDSKNQNTPGFLQAVFKHRTLNKG
jgi:hypothetical protein